MDSINKKEAFVTLATDDLYCRGACALAQSLRVHKTKKDVVVMITPQVSEKAKSSLNSLFDHIIVVDVLDSNDATHLAMLKRPELGITFTKLHCWTLTNYDKCVFMDADTMALCNIDELFNYEELSAAPDAGWPDMFNSGVFVYTPSLNTYRALISLAEEVGSFDGGDQGLLNTYFSDWLTGDIRKHLSFLYNMHTNAVYTYSPAFARFGNDTKVVHFTGPVKPWHHMYDEATGSLFSAASQELHEEKFVRQWWAYDCMEQNKVTLASGDPTQATSMTTENVSESTENGFDDPAAKSVAEEQFKRWKRGEIDFLGSDKFDKIKEKLDSSLVALSSTPTNH